MSQGGRSGGAQEAMGGGNVACPGEEEGLGIWGRGSEGVVLGRGRRQGGTKKRGGGQTFFAWGSKNPRGALEAVGLQW